MRHTGKLYPHSFDGKSIQAWMDDLYKGLVLEKDLPLAILRKEFQSDFLQAVCDTF